MKGVQLVDWPTCDEKRATVPAFAGLRWRLFGRQVELPALSRTNVHVPCYDNDSMLRQMRAANENARLQ